MAAPVSPRVELQYATPPVVQFNAGRAHEQYTALDYDVIPLRPLSKLPLCKGWQKREPVRQWHNAPNNSNIGLRAGNGKAFIDCDDKNQPGTFTNVMSWLEGLGYKPEQIPVVQTASGIGRHVYVNFSGSLLGSRRNFVSTIGAGDFRYGRASFVAAYPSVVEGGGQYTLLQGDLSHLPYLDTHDIATLVNVNETVTEPRPSLQMSRLAAAIASGTKPDKYQSSSEGEAALILSLINSGFDYQGIKHIFDTLPCLGHYRQKHAARSSQEGERWLWMTYSEMLKYSQHESKTRRTIRELQELAERAAWNNVTDKLVFVAHTRIAHKAARYSYAASRRDLALEAGISDIAAQNATKRLLVNKLLSLEERSAALLANRYALPVDKNSHSLTSVFLGSGNVCPSQVVQNGLVLDLDGLETADAFRNGKGKLGRRAGQVYKLLFTEQLTDIEIANRTGASLKTIQRTLKKLSKVTDHKTGEILELVSKGENGRWSSNVVDLDIIEAIYGTRGAKEKQRMYYEKERRAHRRSLELGTIRKGTA